MNSAVIFALLASGLSGGSAPAPAPSGELAHLGDTGVDVHWDAPAGCPGEDVVRARIADLLDSRQLRGTRVTAIARIRRQDDRWNLRLWTVTPSQTRQRVLDYEDCEGLSRAGAYIVALVVDPTLNTTTEFESALVADAKEEAPQRGDPPPEVASAQGAERESEVVAVPVDAAEDEAEDQHEDVPAPRPGTAWRAFVGAGAQLGWRQLPGTSTGFELSVGAVRRHLRVEAGFDLWLPRDAMLSGTRGHSRLTLLAGAVRACPTPVAGPFEFPVCAGFEVGALEAESEGLVESGRATTTWAAFELRPGVTWAGEFLAISTGPSLVAAVARPRFRVDDEVAYQPDRVGFRWFFQVAIRFPKAKEATG